MVSRDFGVLSCNTVSVVAVAVVVLVVVVMAVVVAAVAANIGKITVLKPRRIRRAAPLNLVAISIIKAKALSLTVQHGSQPNKPAVHQSRPQTPTCTASVSSRVSKAQQEKKNKQTILSVYLTASTAQPACRQDLPSWSCTLNFALKNMA